LLADAEEALGVANDGSAEQLVPPWSRYSQGGDDHGPGPVRTCFGHKGVQQGRGGEREERFVVDTTAGRAGGGGPVGNGEGILGLGRRLRITGEETGEQTVGG
jgi:hypothetical protein